MIGGYKKFDNAFAYSETEPGKICLAFYSGIYSYAGWNYLNFMTEELKNPFVNLPRAIYLSLPVVTFLYILANVSYLAVLTPTEMMASNAIAVVSFHFHVTQNLFVYPDFSNRDPFHNFEKHRCFSNCYNGLQNTINLNDLF